MSGQTLVSILAFVVSLASFGFALAASVRAARAEEIKNLLGEKETVGFGAVKLLHDGLPGESSGRSFGWRFLLPRTARRRADAKQRELVIGALMSACLFESSDRARGLLFRVIEKHRGGPFEGELERQYRLLETTFKSMKRYQFHNDQFNARSAELRLDAVRKVLYDDPTPTVTSVPA